MHRTIYDIYQVRIRSPHSVDVVTVTANPFAGLAIGKAFARQMSACGLAHEISAIEVIDAWGEIVLGEEAEALELPAAAANSNGVCWIAYKRHEK